MTDTEEAFAVCIRNDGFTAALEPGQSYKIVPDPEAAAHSMLRVVDESGEDYLYPEKFFSPLPLNRP